MNIGFFITRPIFAAIISIVIVMAGLLALRQLPIAQFPDISPPQIQVSAMYPRRQRRNRGTNHRRTD